MTLLEIRLKMVCVALTIQPDYSMKRHARNGSIRRPGKPVPLEVAFKRAVRHIKRMSRAEQRQSLIDAGIMTRSGKLAPMYR